MDESGHQWFRGTRLYYTKDGHLWLSRAERWQYQDEYGNYCDTSNPLEGGIGVPPANCLAVNCTAYAAMEYRYQGGRGRYMVRPLDLNTFDPLPGAAWRDYLGEDIHGDYGVTLDENEEPVVTEGTAHLAGVG